MSTATAYRIEADPRLPSQKRNARTGRRPDPPAGLFDEDVVPMLEHAPHLCTVTIFEELLRRPRSFAAACSALRSVACGAGVLYTAPNSGGLQQALGILGGCLREHRTDSLSSAFP